MILGPTPARTLVKRVVQMVSPLPTERAGGRRAPDGPGEVQLAKSTTHDGAELSSLLKTRFDTRPLEQSLKVLHESGADYARFAQRGLPNRGSGEADASSL